MKSYRFQLELSRGSSKLFVMLSGANFEDLTGIWRCLPGNLAVDNGGCFYDEPYRTLTLFDKAEFSESVVKDAVVIAQLRVPYKWVHLLNGDEGVVRFYPYGARMDGFSLSNDGWLNGHGRFTAEHGFGGSWARILLDSAKGGDRSAIKSARGILPAGPRRRGLAGDFGSILAMIDAQIWPAPKEIPQAKVLCPMVASQPQQRPAMTMNA